MAIALQRAAAPYADGVTMVGGVTSIGSRSKRGDLLVTLHEPGLTDRVSGSAVRDIATPQEDESGADELSGNGNGVDDAENSKSTATRASAKGARKTKASSKEGNAALAGAKEDQSSPFALRVAVEVKAGTFYMAGAKSLPTQVIVSVMESLKTTCSLYFSTNIFLVSLERNSQKEERNSSYTKCATLNFSRYKICFFFRCWTRSCCEMQQEA